MQGGADLHFPNSERWRKKDQKFKVSLPLLSKGKTSQRYKKIFLNTHKKPQSQKKKKKAFKAKSYTYLPAHGWSWGVERIPKITWPWRV